MPKLQERLHQRKGGKITNTFSLNIPHELIKMKGWKRGDEIGVTPIEGGLKLIKSYSTESLEE